MRNPALGPVNKPGPLIVVRDPGREVAFECLVCGVPFYEGESRAYERHVIACADRHEDELRAQSMRVKAPGLFDPFQSGDVEFAQWVRANGQAILDGRLKMK